MLNKVFLFFLIFAATARASEGVKIYSPCVNKLLLAAGQPTDKQSAIEIDKVLQECAFIHKREALLEEGHAAAVAKKKNVEAKRLARKIIHTEDEFKKQFILAATTAGFALLGFVTGYGAGTSKSNLTPSTK